MNPEYQLEYQLEHQPALPPRLELEAARRRIRELEAELAQRRTLAEVFPWQRGVVGEDVT